jgi:hypothetical protein
MSDLANRAEKIRRGSTVFWSEPQRFRCGVSASASLIGRLGSSSFQTIRRYSVDVAHGLALLFGIGTKGHSIMGFEGEVEQSARRRSVRLRRRYIRKLLRSPYWPVTRHDAWIGSDQVEIGHCVDIPRCRSLTRFGSRAPKIAALQNGFVPIPSRVKPCCNPRSEATISVSA